MRTTLRIDEDILRAARSLARAERRTLGEIVSELARRGLQPSPPKRRSRSGLPTFDVPAGTAPLTPEMVREALENGATHVTTDREFARFPNLKVTNPAAG